MKGFLFSILLCLAYSAQSQTFEMRLTNAGGGVIAVQMRETSGVGTPTTANFLTDLVFGICWNASYGINLNAITTNYTMTKSGPETTVGVTEYQLFAKDPNPLPFPTNWVQNDWVTIMTIPNNLAGVGVGNFSICPVNIQELNINIDFNDYTPTNVGGANGVLIGAQVLTATATQVNVSCNGGNNGSIDVTVVNGTGPYTYNWGVGQPTTQDRTNLTAGTYTVTVTDAVSATATVSATITQPPALVLGTTQVNLLCNGGNNGSIDLTVTGGTSPYTYNWGVGQPTTQDRTGLVAGTYSVTVTDNNNCTATTSATITQPAALALSKTQVNVLCNGNATGSIDLTVAGGTPGYTYNWGVGQPTTQDRTGLVAGTYTVTVTDNNNCTATTSATITQPAAALALSTSAVNATCGSANGSINLTVTGGTPGYTYNWGVGQPTTEDRSGLSAGTYTVTVTDMNGCTATTSATLTNSNGPSLSTSQVNLVCNGGGNGSINLTVAGGTAPFAFNWGVGQPTTEDRSNLAAGTYTVTVTDNNNCTATTSATITQPAALVLTKTQVNVLCNGAATGSIDLTVAGGTPDYTYNWGVGQPTTQDRTGLVAGTYTVTVTDNNNCTATTSATITQPPAIVLSTSAVNATCGNTNGSINLTVTGGTPGYTYNWGVGQPTTEDRSGLGAGTYSVTVTDLNGCTATTSATLTNSNGPTLSTSQVNLVCNGGGNGSIDLTVAGGTAPFAFNWGVGQPTTEDRSNLAAGTYTVTVTDNNNCTATTSATITQPTALLLTKTQVNVLCNGGNNGSIDLTVSGGTPGYTYNWGVGQPTTQDRTGLVAGTYTVTVTDNNNCTATTSATITQPALLSLSTTTVNSSCGLPNGSIDLTVTGGTSNYTYNWGVGQPTTQDRISLAAGTYSVTVTDANNCTATTSATLTTSAAASASITGNLSFCAGGSTILTASGGGTYAWSTGSNLATATITSGGTYTVTVTGASGCTATATAAVIANVANANITGTLSFCAGGSTVLTAAGGGTYAWSTGSNLATATITSAGTYTVTVTAANGCTATATAAVTANPVPVVNITGNLQICPGTPTLLTATGGINYVWSTGTSNINTVSVNAAGTYTVTATNSFGCTGTASVTVVENFSIVVSVSGDTEICAGQTTMLTATSGATYNWSTGAQTGSITTGTAGTYTVTVTNAAGCTGVASATVVVKPLPSPVISGTLTICTDGSTTLSTSGGASYLWSTGSTVSFTTVNTAGTFTVTVTGANGCTASTSATTIKPPALSLTTTTTNVLCNGAATGAVDLTVTGGSGNKTYAWSNGPVTEDISGVAAGTYTVTVTDAAGCTATTSANIIQPTALALSASVTNIDCNGGNTGAINLTATGGTGNKTYHWNTNAATEDLSNLGVGTYTVTVTDANLCTQTLATSVILDNSLILPLKITCPSSVPSLNTNSICQATIGNYGSLITVMGGCAGALNPVSQSPASGTIVNAGTVAVSLTLTNTAGESSTCVFNVNIIGSCH